jgi:hypothetical protein
MTMDAMQKLTILHNLFTKHCAVVKKEFNLLSLADMMCKIKSLEARSITEAIEFEAKKRAVKEFNTMED